MSRTYEEFGKALLEQYYAGKLTANAGTALIKQAIQKLDYENEAKRIRWLILNAGTELEMMKGSSPESFQRWLSHKLHSLRWIEHFSEGGGI